MKTFLQNWKNLRKTNSKLEQLAASDIESYLQFCFQIFPNKSDGFGRVFLHDNIQSKALQFLAK